MPLFDFGFLAEFIFLCVVLVVFGIILWRS